MATKWPEKRRLIGTNVSRVDGPAKATGKARYSFDINRPGLLHAVIVRTPHAHSKIKSIDTAGAEKMPGFKALFVWSKEGTELFFAGAEVVAVCADTEEHARDAARAVKVDYEVLKHQVKEDDVLKQDDATGRPVGPMEQRQNLLPAIEQGGGNVAQGFQNAAVSHEGTYGMPTICHQCLESHGLVAEWNDDQSELTVYASTQATVGTAQQLANRFKLAPARVKCVTHHMGGGYGSKFGPDTQGFIAAELAKLAKAPVKLMLDREEEATVGGNRPSAFGTVKIGANAEGKIVAYDVDCYGTPGDATSRTVGPLPYVYQFPNWKMRHRITRTNAGAQRAMRAPGHPQSCYLTDCAIDDLAAKMGLDPMQMRLKNLPPRLPQAAQGDQHAMGVYEKEIAKAAELADWKKKWHKPGEGKGVLKHGIGMALHTWGGQASPQPNECKVTISRDGSVLAETSTQDLGTAQRTVTALVTAEILGLNVGDITLKIGESTLGPSSGSGGSTTCPSQAPATLQAAAAALEDLFDKIAGKLGSKKEDLSVEDGKVVDKGRDKKWDWKESCAKLGMDEARGTGRWTFPLSQQQANRGISSVGVGGVQVAEVTVDTETGVVRCTRIVAVQDCGLVVNKLACESQVAGGVIMGLNYALFEERVIDRVTGRQCNADMEFYKLGGIQDMPQIVVHMMDMPERGVIGIGEPPTISTHAAIGNAIFNAIGVRVPHTPFTPENVLAALAKKGGQ